MSFVTEGNAARLFPEKPLSFTLCLLLLTPVSISAQEAACTPSVSVSEFHE